MDLFYVLRNFETVERVSNLYPSITEKSLNFLFFLCPKIKGSGLRLNRNKTGFIVDYSAGLSNKSQDATERVKRFLAELTDIQVSYSAKAIFASADSIILFPIPVEPPAIPDITDFDVISNLGLMLKHLPDFGRLYRDKPWNSVPKKVREQERERLSNLLPSNTPNHLKQDFVERTWAGFALDGILTRQGYFGDNPVLLGVESPGVAVLQNSALPKDQWIPIVQLR